MEIGPTAQDLSCPAHLADHSWPYGGPEGRSIENTPLDFIFSNIYYAWFWWSAKNVSWQCIKHVNQQLCMCMYFSHGDDVIALLSSFAYHSSLDCGRYTNICAERLWIPSNDVLRATLNYSANFPEFPFKKTKAMHPACRVHGKSRKERSIYQFLKTLILHGFWYHI